MDAVHTPLTGASGVGSAPQRLKSPTSDTLFAGPANTNLTRVTVSWESVRVAATRVGSRNALRSTRSVPRTATAANPAATAMVASGDMLMVAGVRHHAGPK